MSQYRLISARRLLSKFQFALHHVANNLYPSRPSNKVGLVFVELRVLNLESRESRKSRQ